MVIDAPLVLDTLLLTIYSSTSDTMKIVDMVLDLYDEAVKSGNIFNDDACKFYVEILKEIREQELDTENEADLAALFLKFESHRVIKEDPVILERLHKILKNREGMTRGRVRKLKNSLRKTCMVIRGNGNMRKMFKASNRLLNTSDPNKQDAIYLELLNESRELSKTLENRHSEETSSIDHIDMTCMDSVRKGLESFKAKRADKGYTLGLQQFSKMFGPSGGPVPGECVAFGACSYHYKSGAMMDFARWLAQYNIPKKQTEKPAAIIFISLENEIHENMMMWFKAAYWNTFKKDPDGLGDEEIITTIVQLYKKNGFTMLVFREDGDTFGYEEWKALHDKYSLDYEIIASFTDYLELMKRGGDGKGTDAQDLQGVFSRVKNYGARNNIITVTGLQLNGLAEELAKSGQNNIVKKFGAAHIAGAKAIKRELDVLIFLYIEENHLGMKFLTGWLDKHKYNRLPPDCDRYIAVQFGKHGIVDDLYGENQHVPDIYNISSDESEDELAVF